MLMALSINLSANAVKDVVDSATTVANDVASFVDTSKVSKQFYTDVKAGIAGLAAGLKVSAEKVWDILVKQQLVYSISCLIFSLILGIISSTLINRGWKLWQKAKKEGESHYSVDFYEGIWCGMICLGTIILIVGIIFTAFNINPVITGFINPEYGAIKDIVEFVNK